jgi:hypothetical protein
LCWIGRNLTLRGVLLFEHASFQANDDPALTLVIYTPVRDKGRLQP